MKKIKILYLIAITLLLFSCAAPRSVTNSGKVTPYKQFKFGSNFSGNISSSFASSLLNGAVSTAGDLINKDTITFDESIPTLEKLALSYSLDPIGSGYDFFVRYGVYHKVDLGYKFASGVHVFDAMYQFLGTTEKSEKSKESPLSASIGIQFSSQSYDLPFGLSKIQSFLGYELKRKDLFIPIIFSFPIGENEKYGAFGFGVAYNHAFINYGFDPDNIYYKTINSSNLIPVESITGKNNYGSYGLFINLKVGYEFVYLVTSFSMYYQNYGSYRILQDNTTKFSGYTFIPTIGLQFNTGKIWKKK